MKENRDVAPENDEVAVAIKKIKLVIPGATLEVELNGWMTISDIVTTSIHDGHRFRTFAYSYTIDGRPARWADMVTDSNNEVAVVVSPER
ncbi:MAG: hypothetical protein WC711_01280 [Candidatus Staskawiczbacteria bacterium]|jgi:hypothetical protein